MKCFFLFMFYAYLLATSYSCKQEPVDEAPKTIQQPKQLYHVFRFKKILSVPGNAVEAYDAFTLDISKWWDNSFREKPFRLYLEAKPGGGFYEIFDKEGNGALLARIIYADRGKLLRMEGPLGLSGKALQMVYTFKFTELNQERTQLIMEVHGAGELDNGLPKVVEQAWEHYLFNRFKPYMESRDTEKNKQ